MNKQIYNLCVTMLCFVPVFFIGAGVLVFSIFNYEMHWYAVLFGLIFAIVFTYLNLRSATKQETKYNL